MVLGCHWLQLRRHISCGIMGTSLLYCESIIALNSFYFLEKNTTTLFGYKISFRITCSNSMRVKMHTVNNNNNGCSLFLNPSFLCEVFSNG